MVNLTVLPGDVNRKTMFIFHDTLSPTSEIFKKELNTKGKKKRIKILVDIEKTYISLQKHKIGCKTYYFKLKNIHK